MILPLHSLPFPVVYPKVSYLAHYFSLSTQLLAKWSLRIPSYIICMLMTTRYRSLLQILLYLLNLSPQLSLTYSPRWTRTNCFWIHHKLNLTLNNNISNFLILQINLSASQSESWLHLWLWHVFDQIISVSKSSYPRHLSNSSSSPSFCSHSSCKLTCLQQTLLL